MPGINFIYDKQNKLQSYSAGVQSAANALVHNSSLYNKEFINDDGIYLNVTTYDEYPVQVFKKDEIKIVVEGRIYNKNSSQLQEELFSIANHLNEESVKQKISGWISDADGDYLICIYNPVIKRVILFNDILGRLPFYITEIENKIVISRDVRFLSKLSGDFSYDKFGIAESLLFGYPLAERTLIKNFRRVSPASLIKINLQNQTTQIEILYSYNFEEKLYAGKSLNEVTDRMIELLTDASKVRLSDEAENVLSLSGGLDSRALAVILKNINARFRTATYIGYKEFADKDAVGAGEVAKQLNLDWDLIKVEPLTGDAIQELIQNKNGLNTLSSAFLLSFYKQLSDKFGRNMIYITGDGGDKVFPDHRASKKLNSTAELLNYMISNKYFIHPDKIEKLLCIKKQELYDSIIATLDSYPEQSMSYKYVRFIIMERGVKWLFEAEDRNRFYFWSVAPFYGNKFFIYSMNVDDDLKSGHKLYYEFLNKLSPDLLQIKNALWNVSPDPKNLKFKAFNFMKDTVYPVLPGSVKRKLRMMINKTAAININEHPVMNRLMDDLTNSKVVRDYFSVNELKRTKSLSKAEFYNLLTVLLAMDDLENDESILNNYLNEEFI